MKTPSLSPQHSTHRHKSQVKKPSTSPLRTALHVLALLAWVFVAIVISQIILGIILYSFLREDLYTPFWTTIYTAASYALSCFLVIFLPTKIKKLHLPISRAELGLEGLPKWRDIGLAIIGFVAYFLLAALLVSIFSIFPWFDADQAQNTGFSGLLDLPQRILALVSLVIIAPIAEEIIFRGWLHAKLRSHVGVWIAALLGSVLFGLAHGAWNVGINVFALSIVMILIRELTGTIYGGLILHILKNAIAFYLLIYTGAL